MKDLDKRDTRKSRATISGSRTIKATTKRTNAAVKDSNKLAVEPLKEIYGNVIIVGTGPGSALQITKAAEEAVAGSDIIIASSKKIAKALGGIKRLTEHDSKGKGTAASSTKNQFARSLNRKIKITSLAALDLSEIRKSVLKGKNVSLLVSGDPGIYSLAKKVRRELADLRIITIPAVSSIQYFAAKLNVDWQNVPVISFHGRKKIVSADLASEKYFVLLEGQQDVAALKKAFKNYSCFIGTDLSLKTEEITNYAKISGLKVIPEGLSIAYLQRDTREEIKRDLPGRRQGGKLQGGGIYETNKVIYGIGLGPGDPELLTIKALKRLRSSSKIFYPISKMLRKSVAKDILDKFDLGEAELVPILFPMSDDEKVLQSHWDAAAKKVLSEMEECTEASFVTIGDPLIYSTFIYLREAVLRTDPTINFEVVPGITAFTVVAACAQVPVVEKREDALIFPYRPGSSVSKALKTASTLVIYKAGRHIKDILKDIPISYIVVLGLDLGKKGQKVVTDRKKIEAIANENKSYMATMIVKKPAKSVATKRKQK